MKNLTAQETRILEMVAWGAALKEIPYLLANKGAALISEETVRTHIKNIKSKLGLGKVSELVGWWHCKLAGLEYDKQEIRRKVTSLLLLVLVFIPDIVNTESDNMIRVQLQRVPRASIRVRKET